MSLRGAYTLFVKEVLRFRRVAAQTLLTPVITALLYLVVFSQALSTHAEPQPGVSFRAFLIPGLMMMSILQNSFANSSSSLIQSKVTGNLIFILLSPLSPVEIYAAYVAAAAIRGLAVGMAVYLVALPFVALPVHNLAVIFAFGLLGSMLLGSLGLLAALWADKFEDLAMFQNFIIVPLTFLAGVFYSLSSLPPLWRRVSHWNPLFYLVDGFRYGFSGRSDAPILLGFTISTIAVVAVSMLTLSLLSRGYKIRN